jgi:hypothetical protein
MKMTKFFAIMLGLASVASQAYFWEDFGQPQTQEQLEKRNIDLKSQEKLSHVEEKKADVAEKARKEQRYLNYQKSKIELERQRNRLKVDRY